MAIEASIIIPTFNGAQKLPGLLRALSKQKCASFEIIIIIDGSTDNTVDVIRPWQSFFKEFLIISQENSGRSVARNTGARNAASKLLIFFDDDMLPADNSVNKHCIFHGSHWGLLCGHPSDMINSPKDDLPNYKAWLTSRWTSGYIGTTMMKSESLFFTASNCSIPGDLFQSLGGFNEKLTDAEDEDLARRALNAGVNVFYDKENIAFHNESVSCRSIVCRQRQYTEAHNRIGRTYRSGKSASQTFKRMIYRIFAFRAWITWIDSGVFVPLIPRGLRYRLYSIVVHALSKEYPGIKI